MGRKIWLILLCVWLILYGAALALNLTYDWQRVISGGLLIGVGAFLLADK